MRTVDELARDLTYALGIPHARDVMREHLERHPRLRVAARGFLPEHKPERREAMRRPARSRLAPPAMTMHDLFAAMDAMIADLRATRAGDGQLT